MSEAVHASPIWRDRANFVIGAVTSQEPKQSEQLWVTQVDTFQFRICCIPFFTCGIALDDLVETDEDFTFTKVVTPSGRNVFRVWFGESFHPRDEIASDIAAYGGLLEWSSKNLLGVDAADPTVTRRVADYLSLRQEDCALLYESGSK